MLQRSFFGTDGIRGAANRGIMNADTALKLGMAAGTLFTRGNYKHRVIIGKDTRISCYMFENAITAGCLSAGMDVFLVGPMPTPAIAMLVKSMRADLGVMISASHNPYYDNGIKLFGPDGFKLSDSTEKEIESLMINNSLIKLAHSKDIGRAKRIEDAPGRYIEFVKNTFPKGRGLENFKIVIDCANGAAYHLGGKILWELGANVIEIGVNPDGANINLNCGSNHVEKLCNAVLEHEADLGIALDGDADRLQIVDEKGQVVNGDKVLALIAMYLKKQQKLNSNAIVTTVMSNFALDQFLKTHGLEVVRTQVGDRYVAAKMSELNLNLGGEQSGHVIVGDYSTTGDGLVAALQILALMQNIEKPVSELADLFTLFPQVMRNIEVEDPHILENEHVQKIINSVQKRLRLGRLVVRKSGTEKLIRAMVESQNIENIDQMLDEIEYCILHYSSNNKQI